MAILTGRDLERARSAQVDLMKYTKPTPIYIGDVQNTAMLYDLERRRSETIRACATEWALLTGAKKEEFWTRSIPQALHDTLESYEIGAAIIAAEAFLERYGYEITRPVFPVT